MGAAQVARRNKPYELTPGGRKLVDRVQADARDRLERLLGDLTIDGRETLIGFLARIHDRVGLLDVDRSAE